MTDNPANETRVTKVMTFKSGKVALSRKYRREEVGEDLVRFASLFQSLAALPILPALAAQLDTELIRRSIFGTAAIEGNPLSEERVGEILAEPAMSTLRDRAEQEIANLGKAYKQFAGPPADKSRQPFIVTEQFIQDLNRVITADIAHEHHAPGQYRDHKVEVGNKDRGGVYVPPKIRADIATLMTAFVQWINSEEVLHEGVLVRAALAHYHLGLIHPFGDGNGRTARLLEAVIMNQEGYMYVPIIMSNFYYKNIDDYFIAFRASEKVSGGDVTPFLHFFTRILIYAVLDVQESVHGSIRMFALRDYYRFSFEVHDITRRQYDLLLAVLSRAAAVFTRKDLHLDTHFAPIYRNVSEKTARRDLDRLEEQTLLIKSEKGYRINPFALG